MSQNLETPEREIAPAPSPNARPGGAAPAPPVRRRKSNAELVHEGEDESFVSRNKKKLVVGVILVLAVGAYFMPKPGPSAPVRKAEKVVTVQLPPPPPPKLPPPPPPKIQPPPEKMEKQVAAEDKPKDAPKKAESPPSTTLATGIKGDGPGMGLASSGNGIGGGSGIGGKGGGGGSGKWERYAGQVQSKITDALRTNAKTRAASIAGVQVRIWPDATGKVTRATLTGTSGNAALDAAIQNEVLNGLQLAEAPPAGMHLPIILRLSARRP